MNGEDARRAQQALLQRPEISIRTRIVAVFLILFVLCSGMTVAAVALLSSFESRIDIKGEELVLNGDEGFSFG